VPRGGAPHGKRHRHEGRESRERGPRGSTAAKPLGRRQAHEAAGDYDVSLPLHLSVLTPDAVRAALTRDSRLLVPVGTCEQHGPHLPLGCDTIIVERLADDLSASFGILRAPTVPYGVNTATKRPYPGNAAVRRKTLHRWMNDLLGSWEQVGLDTFIILTAHGHDPHQEALSTLRTRRARVFTVDIFALDFTGYLEDPSGPTHGGELDTSLMLHLAPELVRMDLAQDYLLTERQVARYQRRAAGSVPALSPGSVGRPSLASAEKGARLYKMIHDRIATRVLGAVAA
jgi:creatinine amidohydrolase